MRKGLLAAFLALSLVCALAVPGMATGDFVIEDGVLVQYAGPGGDVTIPGDVTRIGASAFADCRELKRVVIPDGVTHIESSAFEGCLGLETVTLPGSLTHIEDRAFEDCSSLRTVLIPEGVTSIGAYAFSSCHDLESVSLPDSLTSLGMEAFSLCGALEEVAIPGGVTEMGSWTFRSCVKLARVTIGDGVTSVGESAFDDCIVLTEVTIPDTVTSIEHGAFSRCEKLTDLRIPTSVTQIGGGAFDGTPWLKSQGEFARVNGILLEYQGTGGDVTIPDDVRVIGDWSFHYCQELTGVTIPDGVTSIGKYAFSSCQELTDVVIPDSVTSIGEQAFSSCGNVTVHGYIDSEAERYCARGRIPFVGTGYPVGTARAGTLMGKENRSLDWAITAEGELSVAGELGPGEKVLVGCYDSERRFTGLKWMTAEAPNVKIDADTPRVRLFWLGADGAPVSCSAAVWNCPRS